MLYCIGVKQHTTRSVFVYETVANITRSLKSYIGHLLLLYYIMLFMVMNLYSLKSIFDYKSNHVKLEYDHPMALFRQILC